MENKKYGKLSEKITLTMAIWLIIVTAIATLASFWHISSIVTQVMKENLEKYITIRGERESQSLELAEKNQQMLAWRLTTYFQNPTKTAQDYDKNFKLFPDGASREKDEISNEEHPSYFVPKYLKITPELKKNIAILYDFMDRECFLSLAVFNNCWVADAQGSFGAFFREKEGYSSRVVADFKNMEQIWMTVVSPENDPERAPKWTKIYFDPHLNNWMITLSTPLYLNGQYVGAIGNDIFITELFNRIINVNLDGTKNFLFDAEGFLIAHPDFQDRIHKSEGNLKVADLKKEDSALLESFDLVKKELPLEKSAVAAKSVFDLNSKYLLAVTKLDGPEWYLATLYPKKMISDAAFNASRFSLIFGCLGLLLELILLMRLISEKLARPLSELVTVVQKVSAGDLKAKVHTNTQDEFEILGNAFNEMTYNLEVSRNESQDAMRKALEASKVKSAFVANMTHEIRTPLNGILGMTHFLNDTNLTAEQKKYASFITESGNNLLNIINQVLDVSKLDAKKYELEEVQFSLSQLITDVKNVHFFAAKQKGLPIDFENLVVDDEPLWGDVNRLKQILTNLLGNAIKFSDVGSILVQITEIESDAKSRRLRFSVKDQGLGISDEIQAKLFEQFYQGDTSMSRQYGGTGLGLYLVKSFVLLMGGSVGFKSTIGQGSDFWFDVPLRKKPAPPDKFDKERPAPVTLLKDVKPILVVEDNFINQVFTEALIKKLGYTSVVASNGQIAAEIFEVGKFSLVLMDCQMPVMDGYDATREIRKKETGDLRIPIVALTANTEHKDREMCLDSGMNDMLSKPVKIAVFKEKIEFWIDKAAQQKI